MWYAVELKGLPHVLEGVAPCFASEEARIRKLEIGWVLESSAFDHCVAAADVFPIADRILSRICRILALYSFLYSPFEAPTVWKLNSQGKPFRNAVRVSTPVRVYSSKGLAELSAPQGSQPLGSALMQLVTRDLLVAEMLDLVGDEELSWSKIYDIIEFLGGVKEIAKAGFAETKATKRIRQTANHYRHVGSRNRHPLPSDAPTIQKACAFVADLVKQWIASRGKSL